MFKLLRYFSITSAAAVVAVSVFLVFHYRQNAVENLVDLAERQNLVLARSFANIIWPRFSVYVKSTPGIDGNTLRNRQETLDIHKALAALTARLPVLKIKIYNLDGLTVYSSELDEIGIYKINNPGLVAAARRGSPSSKLTFADTISSFEGTVQGRDLVESYLPIRLDNGPVEGVFELYSDVTPLIATIERTTIQLIVSFVLVFGLLYGGLLLIVRRADRILKRQYVSLEEEIMEREEAEEALKKARDELEQRVEERTRDLKEEITERKLAEESLRKLSRAVEQSPAMTIITDSGGKIEYVNPRFSKVTGYNLDEIVGETPRLLKSGEFLHDTYEQLWNTIKAGREWKGEFHNKKKNGELYWAATSISPVTTEDGVVTHFLGISEDITEKKRSEEEARQQRSELAHAGRVIIMGEMATSLAHELSQPLAVISGCAQLCQKTLRSGKGKLKKLTDPMEQISEQTNRANEIIHRIREFIQKKESTKTSIDVNDAINDVADLLRSDAREYGIIVELALAPSLPPVHADTIQIQQVILNLAHNGVEAMAATKPKRRRLTIRTCESKNGMVEVAVHDWGEGINSENLDRIFDPFYTTKDTGIGMGLSISRSIIEAHGGRLWASSEEEDGTVLHFTLPAIDESRRDEA